MALESTKLLKLIVSKFNKDLVSTHDPDDFDLVQADKNPRYGHAYEATSRYLSETLRFRVYFNLGPNEALSKFVFNAVNDTSVGEEYVFVSKGTITAASITNNGSMRGTVPLANPERPRFVDPTKGCVDGSYVLVTDNW